MGASQADTSRNPVITAGTADRYLIIVRADEAREARTRTLDLTLVIDPRHAAIR